ncbi:ectonucleoside triphosphate diphosphohydrolase 2 [Phyllostomus hastatus]|uniref:ectonucleoside triphosphate diphosphohydrolase 2 n=1 Tax=Phyllostomus hastatus TaxID=9423 RepID=UPI001E68291D|nr:ectonucleoside triphosphate diphosphohydrolase 2 [Phyllostomus hastatus]
MARKVLWLLPPLLLAVAGLCGLLLLCVHVPNVLDPPALKYGIVLDAGSSHTAMFVYKWWADKENGTGIVGQHTSCHVDGGGISSYADNPAGAGESLVKCLEQAVQEVPEERHAGTPLYLGATAGMRLLNLTRPEASAKVLEAVTQKLTKCPFDFRGARILSGQDEGVFGWVTTNYLLENFIKYSWAGQWYPTKKGTLGAMDLGGASTQITFETASPIEDRANEVRLRLFGRQHRVYTHSFLCYGLNQVLQKLLAGALQTPNGTHPCWPQGYSKEVELQQVYETPCTAALRPRSFDTSRKVTLRGIGNPALCHSLVERLFDFSSCPFSRCSFNRVFQPPVAGDFMAFSAFFHTVDFLRSVMRLPVTSLEELMNSAVTVCQRTWSQLKALSPSPREEDRLSSYCAGAMFVYQLLSRGYRFDEPAFSRVTFEKKVGDTAVGWALGYMLNLTNMIPAEQPVLRKGINFVSWNILLALFSALLLAALVLLALPALSAESLSAI